MPGMSRRAVEEWLLTATAASGERATLAVTDVVVSVAHSLIEGGYVVPIPAGAGVWLSEDEAREVREFAAGAVRLGYAPAPPAEGTSDALRGLLAVADDDTTSGDAGA